MKSKCPNKYDHINRLGNVLGLCPDVRVNVRIAVRNDGKKMAGEWKALDAYAQVWLPHKSTHTLDVSAPEWKKGAEMHDGVFRG